jgi:hypothetical protein
LQFHKNASRDGLYVDPAFTPGMASAVRARMIVPLDGQVYAQPLYVTHGPNNREVFIAATETNHVTAVDACGAQVWDRVYGSPAAFGDLPCGNIFPTLGITGTPVIDSISRTIYFDAMTQTGAGSEGLRHMIHAISLDDGAERLGWPVDVNASVPGFDSSHQNQRGALTLLAGKLYVPYGGHLGDCGQYFGWIVAVAVADPSSVVTWRTIGGSPWDAGAPISGGGFWAPGGLPNDGVSLFAVSGNTQDPANSFTAPPSWVGGNAVFRLGPGPTFSNRPADYFHPANWADMDDSDRDLGGVNAVLFDRGASHYLVALGKDRNVYVLDRDNLAGDSGALSVATPYNFGCDSYCDFIGVPVVYATSEAVYLGTPTREGGGLLWQLRSDPPVPAVQLATFYGAPIVTSTDGVSNFIVWSSVGGLSAVDGTSGTYLLYEALSVDSATARLLALTHYFTPPIAANGRIVVATCGTCGVPSVDPPPLPNAPTHGQLVFYY